MRQENNKNLKHGLKIAVLFYRLRKIIFLHLAQETEPYFGGEVEVDKSYFSGRRKCRRGRGSMPESGV